MRKIGIESRIYSYEFNGWPALLSNIALSRLLAKRALKNGFDSLIFHKGQAGSIGLKNVRTLCYFHQVLPDDFLGEGFTQTIYKNFLAAIERRLAHIVCNSEYTASRVRLLYPKAAAPVSVVYPGARPAICSEQPSSVQGQDSCYYHSRIHPRKNQLFLLTVFEKLPYKLIISGGTWDRRFRSYQLNLIRKISDTPNVRIATNISEKKYHQFLFESLLFCFPALNEPFGITLLEAMAHGKPIIALESGAVPEVLGEAGILCKPFINEWRRAVSQLVSDSHLRDSLSKRSIARAASFSWEKTAKQLIELFENNDS